MKLKVLLVNPWIYDLSAYNLWCMPIGLRSLADILAHYDVQLALIDCLSEYFPKKYGTGKYKSELVSKPDVLSHIPRHFKRYGISEDTFKTLLKQAYPFDVVMMTSVMGYWYPGVQNAIRLIKEVIGDVPVILGGIYATLWWEHACKHSGADAVVKGTVDSTRLKDVLYSFGFRLRSLKAPQSHDYLFCTYPYALIRTSRGCPFACAYCGSRLLDASYVQLSQRDTLSEILKFAKQEIEDFAFCDDALLFKPDSHIKPLLRELARLKLNIRFHTPNGLHPRYIDDELAVLMKKANFKTIRLSLEGIDTTVSANSSYKVTEAEFKNAVQCLKKANFSADEVSAYLMFGLPAQSIESLKSSIDFVRQCGIGVKLSEFSPVRGTRLWQELITEGTLTDDIDPLLTNNSVFMFTFFPEAYKQFVLVKEELKSHQNLFATPQA